MPFFQTKTFGPRFLIASGGDGTTYIFTLINSILVARLLGPENRGEYAFLQSIVEIASLLLSMGVYWGATYWINQETRQVPKIIGNSLFHWLVVSGICIGLAFFSTPISSVLLPNVNPINYLLILAIIPLVIAVEIVRYFFLGLDMIWLYTGLGVLRIVIWTGINALFLLFYDASAVSVMIAWLVTMLFLLMISLSYLLVRNRSKLHFELSWTVYRNMLQTGVKGLSAQLGTRLMYSGDIYFLNFLLPLHALGNYSVATSMVRVLQRSANVAGTLIFPLSARQRSKSIDELTARVTRYLVFVTIIISITIAIFGRNLLVFAFGPEYATSYTLLVYLLPGLVAVIPPIIIGPYLWGRDYPKQVIFAPYFAFMLNIILIYLLISSWGSIAASVASSIAYIIWAILLVHHFHKATGISYIEILVVTRADLSAIVSKFNRS